MPISVAVWLRRRPKGESDFLSPGRAGAKVVFCGDAVYSGAKIRQPYHLDHTNDLDYVRESYGASVSLHPAVAEPLADPHSLFAPWLPAAPIVGCELTPWSGTTRWNEYEIEWEHAAGHGTVCEYSRARFEKTRAWAAEAEAAVTALCPDGDLEAHYFVFSRTLSR